MLDHLWRKLFGKKFYQKLYTKSFPRKAFHWNGSDGEGRKLGERPGLDKLFLSKEKPWEKKFCNEEKVLNTPLVLAVNDAHLVLHVFRGRAVP